MEDLQQCFRASGAVDEIGVDLDTFLKSLQQVLPQLMDVSLLCLYPPFISILMKFFVIFFKLLLIRQDIRSKFIFR